MNNQKAGLAGWRRVVTVAFACILAIHSAVFLCVDLFPSAPGCYSNAVFICEAKPYYFEGSSLASKELKFESALYEDLWLRADGVSDVVTTQETEGADIDIGEAELIHFVTVDGQIIDVFKQDYSSVEQQLFDKTLNQVSALAWAQVKERCVKDAAIWAIMIFVFGSWAFYLKKRRAVIKDLDAD